MEILDFSKERGIHAIFNGYGKQAYVIHSSFYGFVGYADINDECGSRDITVELYLAESSRYWYWSLKNIVVRGISEAEKKYVSKDITFNIHWLNGDSIGQPEKDFTIKLYETAKECE